MIPSKAFYLVRHGETQANVSRLTAGGRFDSPLTDLGRMQAQELAGRIISLPNPPARIVHSPLSRARDTAAFLGAALGVPLQEMEDLREHFVGTWEGLPWAEVMPALRANKQPPEGETLTAYAHRISSVFSKILDEPDRQDVPLIVAHGGTFYAIGHLYGLVVPPIRNCHLHCFTPEASEDSSFPWRVTCYDPCAVTGALQESAASFGAFCSAPDLEKVDYGT